MCESTMGDELSLVKQPHPEPKRFLGVTWREVEEACARIAEALIRDGVRVDVVVGVLRGGWVPARLLSDYLGVDSMGALEIKFYRGVGERGSVPVVVQPLLVPVQGKTVLVVDDVADTGKTLSIATSFIDHYGPRKVYTATIYVKPWSIVRPDYYYEETDAWIIFPWDKAEIIAELVSKGYTLDYLAEELGEEASFLERLVKSRNAYPPRPPAQR